MKKLSFFFFRISKIWIAILLTGILITYASVVLKSKSICFTQELNDDQKLPGLQFGYSVDDINSFFNSLSKTGTVCYKELLSVWDSIFPLLYGSMYIAWLSLIYKNAGRKRSPFFLINLYPLIPMGADWLENVTELQLLSEFTISRKVSECSANISSLITQLKWVLSTINYLIILSGIVFLFIKKFKTKNLS